MNLFISILTLIGIIVLICRPNSNTTDSNLIDEIKAKIERITEQIKRII